MRSISRLTTLLIIGISTLTMVASTFIWHPASSSASFVAHDVMDDNVFDSVNTMTAAGIDSWLNSNFPGSCISTNNGFAAPDVIGYSPTGPAATGGFSYGSDVSAGTIIYHAAHVYGLNPQVILATLQKEQSLVSGSSGCSTLRYVGAMGYGCPDGGATYSYSGFEMYSINGVQTTSVSGTCVQPDSYGYPAETGFSRQIIIAAWQLKFDEQRSEGNIGWDVQLSNYPNTGNTWDNSDDPQTCYSHRMTQGYRQVCPGGPTNYYDGWTTIDGTSVHMDTGATAALYNYTPHFPGNENFVSIFEGWFGPTIGSLVQAYGDTTVYLLSGTTAYPIYDVNVLNDLAALGPVRQTTASEINTYSLGPVAGRLYESTGGTLYLINASIKLDFPDCNMVADYGYSCSSAIQLSDSQLNKFATGPPVTHLLKSVNNPTVYYVEGGQKRPIPTWGDVQDFKIAVMNTLTDAFVNQIPLSGAYANGPGTLVKTLNSASVYMVKDSDNILPLSDFTYSQEMGKGTSVRTIISYYTVINTNIQTKIECGGGDYISTNGLTYLIPSTAIMNDYGFNPADFVDGGTACFNLSITSQHLDQFIQSVTGAIFYVTGGQKQYITNYAAYQAHGGNTGNTIKISNYFLNLLPDGPPLTS